MRRRRLLIAALVALAGVFAAWATLPPRAMVLSRPAWAQVGFDVAGAYHIHTVLSDGSGTIEDVAAAAAGDGLQFVIITDHGDGTRLLPPAYHDDVLCIDEVEISTTGGHYVALGLPPVPYPLAGEPRDVVADVARLGGFGIVAHPYSAKPALQWHDWDLPFNGIEWMNADSERRAASFRALAAATGHYLFRPAESLVALFTRPVANSSRWDSLTLARRIVGLAGADAHARVALGGSEREGGVTLMRVPSYAASFGAFSIHAELDRPLTGDPVRDARAVLAAVEAGHVYTSLDGLAHPAAFSFTAESGAARASEGDDLVLDGHAALHVRTNDPMSTVVLYRNGVPIADRTGADVAFDPPVGPGVFRVEVGRGVPATWRMPWIVSNPIYALAAPRAPVAPAPAPLVESSQPIAAGPASWHTEHARGSVVALSPDPAADAASEQCSFTLGADRAASPYVAAVLPAPGDLAEFDRLAVDASASRPLRVQIQLRARNGERWTRSVYLDPTMRAVAVPFSEFRAVGAAAPSVPLQMIDAILFVVDLTNARPADSGRLTIGNVRLERAAEATGPRGR